MIELPDATVVKQLFLQCSSLERVSRSLAKIFLFSHLLNWFVLRVGFWGVLEGTLGVRRVLWGSFGDHFGVMFMTF